MGLSAVVFGKLWRDAGLPIGWPPRRTSGRRRAGGQLERALDHARAHSRPDRHARLVLAVSRAGRRIDRRRRQLHPVSRPVSVSRPGLLLGGVPTQVPIFVVVAVGLLGACCTAPRSAAAWSRSAFRPKGHATPAFRSNGWSALVYVLSGLVAEPGGDHLRGAPGPGQGRRRHRLRAGGDHGGRAGRHVDFRRSRQRVPARCWDCSPSPSCKTACGWPTCPPSWPAS